MIVSIDTAAALLKSGEIAAIPTETVYGLAADAFHLQAVKKTFLTKGRPPDNPLIVHISNLSQLQMISRLSEEHRTWVETIASAFWPGPLTLVVPKSQRLPDMVTGGLNTVAIRMPDHGLTLQLIEKTGPLTAPSANRSGRPSPTKAAHVAYDFDGCIPVVDGGDCKIGLESTVLDITTKPFAILRKGSVGADDIEDVTGIETIYRTGSTERKSPGTRYTHYKPDALVQWYDKSSELTESSLLVLHTSEAMNSFDDLLHYKSDFHAFARDLYDIFRTADHKNKSHIFIEPLPSGSENPILLALQDRIERAAGK